MYDSVLTYLHFLRSLGIVACAKKSVVKALQVSLMRQAAYPNKVHIFMFHKGYPGSKNMNRLDFLWGRISSRSISNWVIGQHLFMNNFFVKYLPLFLHFVHASSCFVFFLKALFSPRKSIIATALLFMAQWTFLELLRTSKLNKLLWLARA